MGHLANNFLSREPLALELGRREVVQGRVHALAQVHLLQKLPDLLARQLPFPGRLRRRRILEQNGERLRGAGLLGGQRDSHHPAHRHGPGSNGPAVSRLTCLLIL